MQPDIRTLSASSLVSTVASEFATLPYLRSRRLFSNRYDIYSEEGGAGISDKHVNFGEIERTVRTTAASEPKKSSAHETANPLMYRGPSVAGKRCDPKTLPHCPMAMYKGIPVAFLVSDPRLCATTHRHQSSSGVLKFRNITHTRQ